MDLRIFFISFTCYIHSLYVDLRNDLGFLAHQIQEDNTTQRTFLFSNNRARAAWALSDE